MIIRSLAKKEFKLLMRDRLSAGILLGMPLLFILLLGLLLGEGFGQKPDDRLRIALVNLDQGLEGLSPGLGTPSTVAGITAMMSGASPWMTASALKADPYFEIPFPHRPWAEVVIQDLRETSEIRVEIIPTLEEAQRLISESKRAAIVVFRPEFSARMTRNSFLAEGINPFFRDGVLLDQIGVELIKDETQIAASSIIDQVIQVTLLRVILPYMIGDAFGKLSDPTFINRLGKEVTLPIKIGFIEQKKPLSFFLYNNEMKEAVGRGVQRSISSQFPRYNLTGKTWASLTKSKSRPDFGIATTLGLGANPQNSLIIPIALRRIEETFEADEGAEVTEYRNEDGSGFLHRGAARYQILVPSYTVMFAFSLVLTVGWLFVLERRQGTMRRLLVAPVTPTQILMGKFIPCFLISVFQGIVLLIIGQVLFDMSWGPDSWALPIQFFALLCVVIPTSLAATGLALFIAAFTRSEIQVGLIGSLIVLMLGLLSGCLIPRELMPESMLEVARYTPHAWALDAYRQLLVRPPNAEEFSPNLMIVGRSCVVLLGFGISFLLLAWMSFTREP